MAEFWESSLRMGQQINVPLHIINDTYETVEDSVRLAIYIGDETIYDRSLPYNLDGLQKEIINMPVLTPYKSGDCRMEATINYNGQNVKSIREFRIE
jgi:hypothetical protein